MNGSRSTPDENAGGAVGTSGEVSKDTNNTGNKSTDGNNGIDSTSYTQAQTGNSNGQASKINLKVDTPNKVFGGAEPDIGCVLGTRFEKVDNKVSYDVFCKKFYNYIGRTMNYRNEVVCAVN